MIQEPIKKYLEGKRFREERLWMLRDGVFYTEKGDYLFRADEFDECFPQYNPSTFIQKKENIDSTTNFWRD